MVLHRWYFVRLVVETMMMNTLGLDLWRYPKYLQRRMQFSLEGYPLTEFKQEDAWVAKVKCYWAMILIGVNIRLLAL